jgi:hypothetical protein
MSAPSQERDFEFARCFTNAAGTGELTLLLTCARTAGMQALLNLSASAIDPTDVFQLVAELEAFES